MPGIDRSVPHSARVWNYWLGGKDVYEADRTAGEKFAQLFPDVRDFAQASRGFLVRGTRWLAAEAGIRQFLDVGAGLPTDDNTHQVTQAVNPEARVVYVDHDPMVLLHVSTLLDSTQEGATDYIDADMRDVDAVREAASRTLLFSEPVAVVMSDVIGHIHPLADAQELVRRYMEAVPPGSYLLLSHAVTTPAEPRLQEYLDATGAAVPYHLRTPDQVATLFDGLEMVEPGLVPWPEWRPSPLTAPGPPSAGLGGIAIRTK